MKTFKGTVEVASAKPWTDTKTGQDIVLYSFKLEGMNKWFRTGTNSPGVKEGDNIQFVENGNTVDVASIQQVASSEVQQAPRPAGGGSSKPVKGGQLARDDYWANKEERDKEREVYDKTVRSPMIEYQSARKDATALVVAALNQDALSFGNTAKSKQLGMLIDFVEQVTVELVGRANNFRADLENE